MKRTWILASFLLVAAACGGSSGEVTDLTDNAGADAGAPNDGVVELADGETVDIAMTEFSFAPAAYAVEAGSTVTFAFTNEGKVEHEAVIGDVHAQEEHEAAMAEGMEHDEAGEMEEDSEHGHEAPEIELEPGASGTLEFTFEEPGTFLIGCHVPGHWDAGMLAEVTVV